MKSTVEMKKIGTAKVLQKLCKNLKKMENLKNFERSFEKFVKIFRKILRGYLKSFFEVLGKFWTNSQ